MENQFRNVLQRKKEKVRPNKICPEKLIDFIKIVFYF